MKKEGFSKMTVISYGYSYGTLAFEVDEKTTIKLNNTQTSIASVPYSIITTAILLTTLVFIVHYPESRLQLYAATKLLPM